MNFIHPRNALDIESYPGILPEHVIPPYIKFLSNTFSELPDGSDSRKAVDTYIRLLSEYYEVSNRNSVLVQHSLSFCNNIRNYITYYVQNKYPMYKINVEVKGRIKSPVSASNKFKSKIKDYLQNGKDLDNLVVSDLFAFRLIVTVMDKNSVILGEEVAVPICYDVVEQALEYAKNHNGVSPLVSEPRSNKNAPILYPIFVPTDRPEYVENNEKYIKDYIMYPKEKSNYQSAHIKLKLCVPESNTYLNFEMQIRTHEMNEHAEHGPACHLTYKNRNIVNFLRVPQLFEMVKNNSIDFIDMDESFKQFFNFPVNFMNPSLSFDKLNEFLINTNFEIPIRVLELTNLPDGKTLFSDPSISIMRKPVEIIGKNDPENDIPLEAIALNMFFREKIKPELDELGSH